jgi:acetyl-CoA/propionyl-CoA carboxylase carboxyl transferase subunit
MGPVSVAPGSMAVSGGPAGPGGPGDPRDPLVRLAGLLDEPPSPLPPHRPVAPFGPPRPREPRETPGPHAPVAPDDAGASPGVVAAEGRIHGVPVVAFCTDARLRGGALQSSGCDVIATAVETAHRRGVPIVGLWHSGGARLDEGLAALDGVGRVFAAMVAASGRVPQISVVLGPAAGGAAYGPALSDIVVMTREARMFITGPDVVRSVTGEQIDMAELGGAEAHARRSGLVHLVADDENDAVRQARRLVGLLGRPGRFDAAAAPAVADPGTLLPDRARRAYDVTPVVRAVLDGTTEPPAPAGHAAPGGPARSGDAGGCDAFVELQPLWARNIVTGLGRLGGATVGVVANNPLRKGGCLDAMAAEKAARFVRMCDAFGIPLLVLVDVPGYLPGVEQEWGGVVRRGAKLLHAFAGCRVARVTVVLRKSYGGAYIAMNSRALGATAVFAWPDAQMAVMSAEAAVEILHRKRLAAASEWDRGPLLAELTARQLRVGGTEQGLRVGAVDAIIEPAATRSRVIAALATGGMVRGGRDNTPL